MTIINDDKRQIAARTRRGDRFDHGSGGLGGGRPDRRKGFRGLLPAQSGVSPAVVYWHVGGAKEDRFAERVAQIDPELRPLTAAALPGIPNRIFVLRWQNGADVSCGESSERLLDLLVEGLKVRAPAKPS